MFHNTWVKIWGPPNTFITCQESGFAFDCGQAFCEKSGIVRVLRGTGQHAHVVERHHELLRQTAHRLREQLVREGVPFTNEMIVDEACFANNAMLSIGKTTPYKAVVGQAPNLLQDFEVPNTSMLEDPQHIHRARAR